MENLHEYHMNRKAKTVKKALKIGVYYDAWVESHARHAFYAKVCK